MTCGDAGEKPSGSLSLFIIVEQNSADPPLRKPWVAVKQEPDALLATLRNILVQTLCAG